MTQEKIEILNILYELLSQRKGQVFLCNPFGCRKDCAKCPGWGTPNYITMLEALNEAIMDLAICYHKPTEEEEEEEE